MGAHSLVLISLLAATAWAKSNLTQLTREEQRELDQRIEAFYKNPQDPGQMNLPIPSYSINDKAWATAPSATPKKLSELAGFKKTKMFQEAVCEDFYKKQFPDLYLQHCLPENKRTWASPEPHDKVETLAEGYFEKGDLYYHLDHLPTFGQTAVPVWSDDYWKTKYGQTSYRYARKVGWPTYEEAIASYIQPMQWFDLLTRGDQDRNQQIINYSPAEKYDITVGDEFFSLTNAQKNVGKRAIDDEGKVQSWMGICHGWSAASVTVPPPREVVKVTGANGAEVTWYPNDIKAMLTLAWANAPYKSNYVGKRCKLEEATLQPNGRLSEQQCFDNNPMTYHLALGNFLGRKGKAFVMDKTFDYEVWNQPIHSYEFTYFNPLSPATKSKNWREVAVDYDATFKAFDRFQSPLTRGHKTEAGYDDSHIRKIVGVTVVIVYVAETTPPPHSPEPSADRYKRAIYNYDLELQEVRGNLYPTGGEWHTNSHPDFLWVPKVGSTSASISDRTPYEYTGEGPTPALATLSRAQSAKNIPLCRVLRTLVAKTNGFAYPCP